MNTLSSSREINSPLSNTEIVVWLGLYVLLYGFVFYFNDAFIFTDLFYEQSLSQKLPVNRISDFLVQKSKFEIIGYAVLPILFFIKVFFPACCLYACCYLKESYLKWRDIIKIVLISEIIFFVPLIIRLVYFIVHPPQSIEEVSHFAPFSLVSLFGTILPSPLLYACQTINLFEAGYCLLLAKAIQSLTGRSMYNSIGVVLLSYGTGLLLWIVFITFLNVQIQ